MSHNKPQIFASVLECLIVFESRLDELLREMMSPATEPLPVRRDLDTVMVSPRMGEAFSAVKQVRDAVDTAQRNLSRTLSN